jgi:hypothetical protein
MKVAKSWEPKLGRNQIIVENCESIKLSHGVKVIKRIEKKGRRKQRENNEMDGKERRKVKEKGDKKETFQSIFAHILLFTLFDLVAFP